ncbi:MAG: response regulator transcription factor [Lachnospiraceae bacterium]|nr:response regulator transcription factor [Lachnospiraceae bacterium]
MKERILLVEDDKQIREILRDYLEGKTPSYEVTCAENGTQGLQLFRENEFDLVLLDVMLPGRNGFSMMKEIRRSSDIPVIFITARTMEEDRLYGYELGCDDYVCKPFSFAELHAKVTALIKRSKGMVRDEIISCGAISFHKRSLTVTVNGKEIELAPKELSLLAVMLERKDWVFSREALLDLVWGKDYFGGERVVDNHVKKLRKSLGSAGAQIKTVIARGYKITE